MKTPTLYLDTSVIGGYFDDEFKSFTRELWKQASRGFYKFVVSQITVKEVSKAPLEVQKLLAATFKNKEFILEFTEEAAHLANAYLKAGVVTRKYYEDAAHVAIAVVHRMDFIVSWNFKHMVNIHRNDAFNAVNLLQGYMPVRIVNPYEVIYGKKV